MSAKSHLPLALLLASVLILTAGSVTALNVTDKNSTAYAQSSRTTTTAVEGSLLVGDTGDNTIKRLDIETGEGGVFVPTSDAANNYNILGPRGVIVSGKTVFLSIQNVDQPIPGEVVKYDIATGKFISTLVSPTQNEAPFAPRGIALSPDGKFLYVADFISEDDSHGYVRKYNAGDGKFIAKFFADPSSSSQDDFFPRGLVFGPDGKLYVSVSEQPVGDPLAGYIMSFDPTNSNPNNTFKVVVASNADNDYDSGLHRPEGIVFSPDKKTIWVCSFRADSSDTDKLMGFNLNDLMNPSEIILQKGDNREFAMALLFGPSADLFVPISSTGELRRYTDLQDGGKYTVISESGNPLSGPWYLTFKTTNPSTLAFGK